MPPQTAIIVDIETRNDTDLMALHDYYPKEGTFLPLIYHLPCAIAIGRVDGEGRLLAVESLGDGLLGDDPCELTQSFWDMVGHAGTLISFNGRGFDIPVMELCALRYGCAAARHWTEAHGSRYRYGKAHLDLLDILSNYGGATKGLTLANVVQLLGYKGKDGMDGSMVQGMYEAGKIEEIQAYNRRDVICTYAVWLQYARISGRLTEPMYHAARSASKPFLEMLR